MIETVTATGLAFGFALEYHDDGAGLLHIALAHDTPVSGSGVVAEISFRPFPAAAGDVTLTLAAAALQRTIVRHGGTLRVGTRRFLPLALR